MHDFLLITKYSMIVLAVIGTIAAVFVLLTIWVSDNSLDLDLEG